jgi:Ca2+-binding EF-hand superfamily protein
MNKKISIWQINGSETTIPNESRTFAPIQSKEPIQKALSVFVNYSSNHLLRKTINSSISSYGLKHRVEELSRALEKIDPSYSYEYIGNKDFINAMIDAGFIARQASNNRLNYYFNLGKLDHKGKWLKDMVQEYKNDYLNI